MARIDHDEYFPVWLPEELAEDVFSQSTMALMGLESGVPETPEADSQRESLYGYIIRDWFGPFLLSPPTRSLRGRC